MNYPYKVLAERIKQELIELEKVVNRVKRGINAINDNSENQD
ncbi:hypothetical protein [Crocosphaera chwakensis]|uniref:Uncharacterized protein n=1 Tax=Crocosphaera chwakensis CCY0110 TaxID=391612 RepID=A3IR22_9CHRO|nr:hypothetical protein [Crocosphaera chwakensis]EAZ91012.1 hypothetical protein CY0110_27410 [Crocosphaera chwakensis CCY0110]